MVHSAGLRRRAADGPGGCTGALGFADDSFGRCATERGAEPKAAECGLRLHAAAASNDPRNGAGQGKSATDKGGADGDEEDVGEASRDPDTRRQVLRTDDDALAAEDDAVWQVPAGVRTKAARVGGAADVADSRTNAAATKAGGFGRLRGRAVDPRMYSLTARLRPTLSNRTIQS